MGGDPGEGRRLRPGPGEVIDPVQQVGGQAGIVVLLAVFQHPVDAEAFDDERRKGAALFFHPVGQLAVVEECRFGAGSADKT